MGRRILPRHLSAKNKNYETKPISRLLSEKRETKYAEEGKSCGCAMRHRSRQKDHGLHAGWNALGASFGVLPVHLYELFMGSKSAQTSVRALSLYLRTARSYASIRQGPSRRSDPNPVVREGEMKARICELGHMASDAQLYSGRASSAMIIITLLYPGRNVALQALGVIRGRIFCQRLVRVMAGDAGDASVSSSCLPAAAVLQTVGCKADVQPPNRRRTIQEDILPGAVTGSTEVDRLNRIQV